MTDYSTTIITTYKNVLNGVIISFPRHFWVGETGKQNAIICTKYLIEEILNYTEEDIKKKIILNSFVKNKLTGMMRIIYNDSTYQAINAAYPGKFLPWNLKCCPMYFWENEQNRQFAFNCLLKINNLENENFTTICEKLEARTFIRFGMCGLIDRYDGRLYDLLTELYFGINLS